MDVVSFCRIFVTGNDTDGYTVTFSDYTLNKRLSFKVAHHGWILAHLDHMQGNGQLGSYALFDTSDKAAD